MSHEAGGHEEQEQEQPVGYGQPPKQHRFKPGVSGNKEGRPKKKRPARAPLPSEIQIAERIFSESRRLITVRENGELLTMSTIDAVLRAMAAAALNGNPRAQFNYANLVRASEKTMVDGWEATIDAVMQYKRDRWEEIKRCKQLGKPDPDPVPHPDEIVLDHDRRTIIYNGPSDAAHKAAWDRQFARARLAHEGVKEYEQTIRAELSKPASQRQTRCIGFWIEDMAYELLAAAIVERMIPKPDVRRVPGFNLEEWRRQSRAEELHTREGRKRFIEKECVRLRKKFDDEDPESIA